MLKKIIFAIAIIMFIAAIGTAILFGVRYYNRDAEYRRFVAAEYQRACSYQSIIIELRRDTEKITFQSDGDRRDNKKLRESLARERANNQAFETEIRQLREINERTAAREREAIERLINIIKQLANSSNN